MGLCTPAGAQPKAGTHGAGMAVARLSLTPESRPQCGSDRRLARARLVWAMYHNSEPAQWRSECKRHYRRPGHSPLAKAGIPPGEVSYLDALRL